MHSLIRIVSALLLCTLLASCGGATGAPATQLPTSAPPPTSEPAATAAPMATQPPTAATPQPTGDGTLSVAEVAGYKDRADYLHIVGRITNGTATALTAVQLQARALDAAGQDLLAEADDQALFAPLIATLPPGTSAPFRYTYDIGDAEAASYEVVIKSSEATALAGPELRVEHDQLIVKDADSTYIVGELVNMSATPVAVDALAGAVLDAQQRLVTADLAEDVAGYLAAAGDPQGLDRTPFLIALDSSAPKGQTWSTYVQAHPTEPRPAYDVSFDAASVTAPDASGYIHLIGHITNNGSDPIETMLIAAIYGEDGTVLDADAQPTGFNVIGPGFGLPYDFAFKVAEGGMPPIASTIVRIDPSQTTSSSATIVAMSSADNALEENAPFWFARGSAVNSSTQPVTMIDVVVTLVDGSGALLGVAPTRVYPDEDTLDPGASVAYETFFQAIPGTSMDDVSIVTLVQGYVE
jgi:hypothetical protein